MASDAHRRNPVWGADYGPPTAIQPRLTGTSQTGRLVVIGNPISYVVEPGRYYPFLSLRGHQDPLTNDLSQRMILGDVVGEEIPSNQEPRHVTPGYAQTLAASSTRGAVRRVPHGNLANTTLLGTGPEGLPAPEAPDGPDFYQGIPHSLTFGDLP